MIRHLPTPDLPPTPRSVASAEEQLEHPPHASVLPPAADALESPKPSRSSSPSRSFKLFPFLNSNKSQSRLATTISPDEAAQFEAALQSVDSLQDTESPRAAKLSSWFSGTSEPVKMLLIPTPTKEESTPFFDSADESGRTSISTDSDKFSQSSSGKLHKIKPKASHQPKDVTTSKFPFWKSRAVVPGDREKHPETELLDIDVHGALLQDCGQKDSQPEQLQRLETNAEQLVNRLQVAYVRATKSAREAGSENSVLSDELEACRSKSENLKLQLENMASKMTAQESAMQSMAEELANLRHQLRQDADFRRKSLRLVMNDALCVSNDNSNAPRLRRDSYTPSFTDSSVADSIFSGCPPRSCTPSSAIDIDPHAFQVSQSQLAEDEDTSGCQNCHGVDRSEAWDVIHMLKEESKALKERLVHSESANEDILSLVESASIARLG